MNDNYTFYQMPKFLFSGRFNISSQAKILYSLLLDRQRLSVKNNTAYTDEKGRVYVLFCRESAAEVLSCNRNTVTTYMRELISCGLIETKTTKTNKRRIYLKDIEETEIQSSCEPKNGFSADRNSAPNNNKYSNNYSIEKYQKRNRNKGNTHSPNFDLEAYEKTSYINPMELIKSEEPENSDSPDDETLSLRVKQEYSDWCENEKDKYYRELEEKIYEKPVA